MLPRLPLPRPTIRLRLTLLYGALFLAAGLVVLLVSYTLVRQSFANERVLGVPTFVVSANAPAGVVQLEQVDGTVDWSGEGTGQQQITGSGGTLQVSPEPVLVDGRTLNEVIEEYEADVREEALDELLVQSGTALGLTALAAIVLGWLVAGRVLRPVRAITNAARRASDTNLRARVNLRGPRDELRELADTFDHMLGRLEVAFESQRRFAAQASHELRTPIAIIRAEADVALADPEATERERRLARAVQAAAARGERLISSLLALARSQSTLLDYEPVDLAEVVGDVVGDLAPRADGANVQLDLRLSDAPAFGDRVLLERLALNLVENAIIHNVDGGWAQVEVGSERDWCVLRVENSGMRIGSDAATLLEPFQRETAGGGAAPPGSGLGLAIVQAIVDSHAGTVAITPRLEGGLLVVVRLPTADLVEDPAPDV